MYWEGRGACKKERELERAEVTRELEGLSHPPNPGSENRKDSSSIIIYLQSTNVRADRRSR